jgi:hypothetical protein
MLGPFGAAASRTAELDAYDALCADQAALARLVPDLEEIARTRDPGAVIYAMLLLRVAGRDLAPLIAQYRDDRREVGIHTGGCIVMPPRWLCEAVRWVNGETWAHPAHIAQEQARQLRLKLDEIVGATCFELPSEQAIEFQEKHITPKDIHWPWTRRFLEMLCGPRAELRTLRPDLDALASHPSLAVRLYAALLVRAIDREAGQRMLDAIPSEGVVPLQPPRVASPPQQRGWFAKLRKRRSPSADARVAELVDQLKRWPH